MAGIGVWLRRLFGDSEQQDTSLSLARVQSERNDFALAMYEQLRVRPGNVFFSPFSIRTVLAMAQAGARGETANQMGDVLRLSISDEVLPVTQTVPQRLNAGGANACVQDRALSPAFQANRENCRHVRTSRQARHDLPFDRSQADFSGINGYRPPNEEALFISAIYHKAFLDVNEVGTEAAAATAVGMDMLAMSLPSKRPPIPVFRADHPFFIAIRDRKSGTFLFLGRISDPTRDS
jgi:serine protease inhibitor